MSQKPDTNADLVTAARAHLMDVGPKPPVVMERGQGVELFDVEGRRYLDFVAGWAVDCLGHSPPAVADALAAQGGKLLNSSPSYWNAPQIAFARRLTEIAGLGKVWFGSTGAEANEGAIKLARKWGKLHRGGAFEVITALDSFHGRTLATMAATGKPHWQTLFPPAVPGFVHVPFNDLAAARAAVSERTVAVMVEPVQGEGGAVPATPEYLRGLRALCDERGLLLILDEVQTGYGRTGSMFAFERYGLRPDVLTLAKGIGAGFPLSALLARDEVCVFEPGDQGGTYSGQPLAMAVGLAVLNEVTRLGLPARAAELGAYLREGLSSLERDGLVTAIRGAGLLLAFDAARRTGPEVVSAALARGLLVNSPRPKAVRLMPPLILTRAHVDEALGLLREVL
jgi:acetylornithine/N-succinyldiaminopimelate aminotransferase